MVDFWFGNSNFVKRLLIHCRKNACWVAAIKPVFEPSNLIKLDGVPLPWLCSSYKVINCFSVPTIDSRLYDKQNPVVKFWNRYKEAGLAGQLARGG